MSLDKLAALPPGKSLSDKFSLGIYKPDNQMVGYLDLVRDFPSTGEWHIGLLMLDPQMIFGTGEPHLRGHSSMDYLPGGTHHLSGRAGAGDASRAVLEALGFEEVSRQSYTSETGRRQSRVIIMRHRLVQSAAADAGPCMLSGGGKSCALAPHPDPCVVRPLELDPTDRGN